MSRIPQLSDQQRADILSSLRMETLSETTLKSVFNLSADISLPMFPLYGRRFDSALARRNVEQALGTGYIVHGKLIGIRPGIVVLLADRDTHRSQATLSGFFITEEKGFRLIPFVVPDTDEHSGRGIRSLIMQQTAPENFPRLQFADFVMTIEVSPQWEGVDQTTWAALSRNHYHELTSFLQNFFETLPSID